jgi:hypothetical protein
MRKFFIGLHQCHHVQHFDLACMSINRLRRPGHRRKSNLPVREGSEILLDSGAFTEITTYGEYRHSPHAYANTLRWALPLFGDAKVTAVAQDMMCEPFALRKTGLTVQKHQKITIERYDALTTEALPCPIMPVLQGYDPEDYVFHLRQYDKRLTGGMWVGVGSVCKRNKNPVSIAHILSALHDERPDLRFHGFGVKRTALLDATVRKLLWSADSMAWSAAARHENTGLQNDWHEAERFRLWVEAAGRLPVGHWQPSLRLRAPPSEAAA